MFKRSLSMAEMAAAELVRQEEREAQARESLDVPALKQMAALALAEQQQQQRQAGDADLQPHSL